jgi:hypothetical protein
MVDFSSAVRPDVYRVIASNLVPGFVGVAPWVAGVFWPSLQSIDTWSSDGAVLPVSVTLAAIVFTVGLLFEDIGSRIEIFWADRWLSKKCPRLARGWRSYLSQRRDNDLIAQGYLRAILLRFKFELSMVPAAVCCGLGLVVAQAAGHGVGVVQTLFLVVVIAVLLWMLLDEIRSGAIVLARTRQIIVRAARDGRRT